MGKQNSFAWVNFYMELAGKLLPYAKDRGTLVNKIKGIYQETGIALPTLEKDGNVFDIDPFTTFGLFNKGITVANRIKIIKAFAKAFSVSAPVPSAFDGIPVLNNQKATFYWFEGERGPHDIDHLWTVFSSALEYADTHSEESREQLIRGYDTALQQKGVKWNLTMGLYWVRPVEYINLDARNRWFISQQECMSKDFVESLPAKYKGADGDHVPSGKEYLEICKACKTFIAVGNGEYVSLPELSMKAWAASDEKDKTAGEQQKEKEDQAAEEQEKNFRKWLSEQESASGDLMTPAAVANNALALRKVCSEIKLKDFPKLDNLFSIADLELFRKIRDAIINHPEYDEVNQKYGRGYLNSALTIWYEKYLEQLSKTPPALPGESKSYTEKDFLSEVYMAKEEYEILADVLKSKKNIILQGAPGVGKTFVAKRLAYSVMGEKDENRVMMVQFHQSYSYEDFIMGFRPSAEGFELKKGSFYNFCKKAEKDSAKEYFFIIDEINRGNLSRIFGELFMLIETDKRGTELQLLYTDEEFSVPANVYIIGTMNTADRSLAMLDYALRRRFAFIDLKPGFKTERFVSYRGGLASEKFNRLIACVESLNGAITADENLGEGFCVGHSYFCNLSPETVTDRKLQAIVEFEIIQLLKEYWYDEPSKVHDWSNNLRSAIK